MNYTVLMSPVYPVKIVQPYYKNRRAHILRQEFDAVSFRYFIFCFASDSHSLFRVQFRLLRFRTSSWYIGIALLWTKHMNTSIRNGKEVRKGTDS